MDTGSLEKFRETIGKKYGIIKCYGPDGEYYEARSQREASELTGVTKSSIGYALKNCGRTGVWRFERDNPQTE